MTLKIFSEIVIEIRVLHRCATCVTLEFFDEMRLVVNANYFFDLK
jgi:hypothetical protein